MRMFYINISNIDNNTKMYSLTILMKYSSKDEYITHFRNMGRVRESSACQYSLVLKIAYDKFTLVARIINPVNNLGNRALFNAFMCTHVKFVF